jgi:TolB-like protein/tetratricopeptide (TPR) repeat protein
MPPKQQTSAFILDMREQRLYRDGAPVALTAKSFALLNLLVHERGRLLTKEVILDRVWPEANVSEACIKDYIKDLRRSLDDDPFAPRHIETARGRGYRYIGDMSLVPDRHPGSSDSAELAASAPEPVVAVMPLANRGDESDAYLADGLTEDLIAALGRFRELAVISHCSAFQCRGEKLDPRELARRVGAEWLVTGSIRRSDEQLLISVQLQDGTTGRQVWAERYARPAQALLDVQDEIVCSIVATLAGCLDRLETRRALARDSESLRAYDWVLRARHHLSRGTPQDILAARGAVARALETRPDYAPAYTCLAEAHYLDALACAAGEPESSAQRMLNAARRAVELDELDSRAYLSIAWAQFHLNESIEVALSPLQTALQLNPNDYHALCFRSTLCLCSGDIEAAIRWTGESLRRSPLAHAQCLFTLGFAHYSALDYEQALVAFGRISQPRAEVHAGMAACYASLGRNAEADSAVGAFQCAFVRTTGNPLDDDAERWLRYWKRILPFRDGRLFRHLLEGLSRAGLPTKIAKTA